MSSIVNNKLKYLQLMLEVVKRMFELCNESIANNLIGIKKRDKIYSIPGGYGKVMPFTLFS